MPSWFDLGNIWKTVREVDLRPIREEAERNTQIYVVGDDESAKMAFIRLLCEQPLRPVLPTPSILGSAPVSVSLAEAAGILDGDLYVLISRSGDGDLTQERMLVEDWRKAQRRVVIFDDGRLGAGGSGFLLWSSARRLIGSLTDRSFFEREFIPAALALLPEHHLSLARFYAPFRLPVAKQLIAETSIANASYSISTGLAEIIPILDVPFNLADMVILTKAQAIMAYKLGLALGLPGNWQEHIAAFGGTIGSGFVWRQIARQLVGFIPVWGIIPKVAIAYAGTYVLGQAILQWYLTGNRVTPELMRQWYKEAFAQGKEMARNLVRLKPRGGKRKALLPRFRKSCSNCGASNPGEFNYCGRCGTPLGAPS